ncbi:N-acyl-phosphatidylethanolamine-hydrolyzing phospholipase D-like isoform X2 [Oppia nitens]|nr:N-acyl-phosphatidylethanolamine-hydrolyzing phospholipase D-like isoform X2 [Oppia nitens]XP_054162753.1 N-acyl-phosphatidylethanolamine-hydrolyzing phospholipase D-like isoform X2 [Oppia nitens]XP_054162754.1 N-acyl-phosphatidylethanolamine-hydrolyzing phospholipase D-like isoform X2 [Oppia nitens]
MSELTCFPPIDDNDPSLMRPIHEDGMFNNPWRTWKKPNMWSIPKFMFETDNSKVPKEKVLDETLPLLKPNFNFDGTGISLTWIGHATTLVHIDGLTLLTDPIFSDRASPSQYFGPTRYRKAAVSVKELPQIDAVVISHNHYDHLDLGSVLALKDRFGSKLQWFVPLGLSQWMRDEGVENVVEMDWWQTSCIITKPDIKFVFTPAQHWTRRGVNDERKTLWGGWSVIGPKHKFYFAGDTGYCPAFEQIGKKYGPFDIAAIPIGAYEPRWFMQPQHVDPEEAVKIHQDVKSKLSIGIHWGTFALAHEYYLEPPMKLKTALKDNNLDNNEFITISHGETKSIS